MMGVGKSTIGKRVASRLSFNFIDIDQLIEQKGLLNKFNFQKKRRIILENWRMILLYRNLKKINLL